MEPAVSRLETALAATQIKIPRIPVISNVDAQPHSDPGTIKKILARQVSLIFLACPLVALYFVDFCLLLNGLLWFAGAGDISGSMGIDSEDTLGEGA